MKRTAEQNLAANLRALKDYHGVNQAAAGKIGGLGQSHISMILRTKHALGIDKLDNLAAGFGVEPWQLLLPPAKFNAEVLQLPPSSKRKR
jgi:transcriptional regulator with XRE-family HTH domain